MATNPVGLYRSRDIQTDLDLIFENLQYLRDTLPKTTSLGADKSINFPAFAPIDNNLSYPIKALVKFEGVVLVKLDPGIAISITGPSFNYLRYELSQPVVSYIMWNSATTGLYGLYKISGFCEPSVPGILSLTAQTSGTVTISALSHLTVTEL